MANTICTSYSWILSKDIVAFHGTSVNCLNEILAGGKFDSPSYFSVVGSRLRRVLTESTRSKFEDGVPKHPEFTLNGAYNYARNHARSRAFYDFLYYEACLQDVLDQYQENHNNMFDEDGLDPTDRKILLGVARQLGHKPKETREKLEAGLKRRGVIIGIHEDFFGGKTTDDFDFNGGDISYPKYGRQTDGVSSEFIGSIYVATREERALLGV